MHTKTRLLSSIIVWGLGSSLAAGAQPVETNYRSIGTREGPVYAIGTATVDAGELLVTFQGASLPNPYATGAVGRGDKLVIGGETLFVLSRISPTQIVVQGKAASDHVEQSFLIERAYRSFQEWESDWEGNLVAEGRREVGVAYNDGPFGGRLVVDGSETDERHYLQLTVAEGQRHDGVGSIGTVVEPEGKGDAIDIRDDFTRIEWLEIRGWKGRGAAAIRIGANRTSLTKLIVHDGDGESADGIVYSSSADGGGAELEGALSSSNLVPRCVSGCPGRDRQGSSASPASE